MTASHMLVPAIVAILVFLAYMVAIQFVGKKDTLRDRIRRMAGPDILEPGLDPLRLETEVSPVAQFLDRMLRLIGTDTENFRKNEQLRFYQAGFPSPDAPVYYLFFQRFGRLALLVAAAAFFFTDATGTRKLLFYALGALSALAGLFGADLLLKNQRLKRERLLLRGFPDALDLLLVCVESGLALDGALARVCQELGRAHPEITQELNRTRLELTLLNDRAQALINLAERTDMVPFRSLATTLLQSERFGTSLTETLRVSSEDYRNTQLMMAEDRAGRLPVLITVPLILMMMPALFLIILGPALLRVLAVLHSR